MVTERVSLLGAAEETPPSLRLLVERSRLDALRAHRAKRVMAAEGRLVTDAVAGILGRGPGPGSEP
jgi:hypothetical protein